MGTLSILGIALSIVFTFLFLALIAEVYYLLWWKNRTTSTTATKQLLALFCFFKKQPPSSLTSTPSDILNSVRIADDSDTSLFKREDSLEEGIEAELIRLHNLPGFPRLLFTIEEETKEDMESDDGKSRYERTRKGSRGRSLSELFLSNETPFLTPLASPPVTSLNNYNPLFELKTTTTGIGASPPPKFKFLRDAEEKLYRKTLVEEAMKVHWKGSFVLPVHSNAHNSSNSESKESQLVLKLEEEEEEEEKGSLKKIVIGHPPPSQCSSQVTPLSSSPTIKNSMELSDSSSRA